MIIICYTVVGDGKDDGGFGDAGHAGGREDRRDVESEPAENVDAGERPDDPDDDRARDARDRLQAAPAIGFFRGDVGLGENALADSPHERDQQPRGDDDGHDGHNGDHDD